MTPELPSLDQVAEARASAHKMANALDEIEQRGPMADAWETVDLKEAIGLFSLGEYGHALRMAVHAMTPPDQRSREYPLPTETWIVKDLRKEFLGALGRDKVIEPRNA